MKNNITQAKHLWGIENKQKSQIKTFNKNTLLPLNNSSVKNFVYDENCSIS